VVEEISKTELAFGVTVPIPICACPGNAKRKKNRNNNVLVFFGVDIFIIISCFSL
jgi:hypothetical protein